MLVFEERWNRSTRRKPLGAEWRINSTHIWRRIWESNPGHIGGMRVLSPLRDPCTPATYFLPRNNRWAIWAFDFFLVFSVWSGLQQVNLRYVGHSVRLCWLLSGGHNHRPFHWQVWTQTNHFHLRICYRSLQFGVSISKSVLAFCSFQDPRWPRRW